MTVRLDLVFNGSPDEEGAAPTLREILVGAEQEHSPFSQFVRWRRLSKKVGTWVMAVDVLPFDRPKLVYILPTEEATSDDVEATAFDLTLSNCIPLRLSGEREFDEEGLLPKIVPACIDISDRVFVVNIGEIDDFVLSAVAYATEVGRPIVYLRY